MVVGLEHQACYYKLAIEMLCLRHSPDCLFVATNTNGRGLFTAGQEWPDAAAMVAAVQAPSLQRAGAGGGGQARAVHARAAGRAPGPGAAPHAHGGRLAGDGRHDGLATLLVLSLGAPEAEVLSPDNAIVLSAGYCDSLADLLPALHVQLSVLACTCAWSFLSSSGSTRH